MKILQLLTGLLAILALTMTACSSGRTSSPPDAFRTTTTPSQDAGPRPIFQADDDENCGATGYACVNGRSCDAGLCEPAWQTISTEGTPDGRGQASAATLNGQYVIFGGCLADTSVTATGGTYDPPSDTWSSFPDLITARAQHTSVSTSNEIYTLGGISSCYDGEAVGPGLEVMYTSDQGWVSDDASGWYNAYNIGLAYTGTSLFSYGGSNASTPYLSTGSALSLGTQWTDVSCNVLSNCPRSGLFAAFLDGPFIRVWGNGATTSDGLLYDLTGAVWSTWTAPDGTPDFGATQPDSNVLRYADDGRRQFYVNNDGTVSIYDRETVSWTTDASTAPEGFCNEAATTWVGHELIAWSGICSGTVSTVGARYQPPAP